MNNIPFPPEKKSKVDYMWRDIERRALSYGIAAPKVPAPYPLKDFDLANRTAIVANQEGWYMPFLEQTYYAWFVNGLKAGSLENIKRGCEKLGKDYSRLIEKAAASEIEAIYYTNTQHAKSVGVFGAPSFSVGSDIFWGDDRLEDAIRFSRL